MALVDPLGPRHRPGMRGPCRRLAHWAVDPGLPHVQAFTGSAAGTTSGWLSSAVGLLPRPAVMAGKSGGHRHIIAFDRPAPKEIA